MLHIDTRNNIIIDGLQTGLALAQTALGTVIYTPERGGHAYMEHAMPYARYAASHDAPASGVAGCAQLERDVLALLARIDGEVAA